MLILSGAPLLLGQLPATASGSGSLLMLNGECLPGFCAVVQASGPPPGQMFLALGLVAYGLSGLWRQRKAAGQTGDQ